MNDVVTIITLTSATLSDGALELVSGARRLAVALDAKLVSCVVGPSVNALADTLMSHGADHVYCLEHDLLADYCGETYSSVLEPVWQEVAPIAVLFEGDSVGRDLAPRVAWRLDCGLVTDCVNMEVDASSESLLFTRPVFGGKAMAVLAGRPPQVAVLRPRAFEPVAHDPSHKGTKVSVPVALDPSQRTTRIIESVRAATKGIQLEAAKVIVAGGRGIGSREEFASLVDLASALGGAVGASRGAVDEGWATPSEQIGQTGKIVAPDVYIAVGISGASQHVAGMSGSKCVIAINRDERAPIFEVAHYGLIDDYRNVLPTFIQALNGRSGNNKQPPAEG